jgi:hypothetical protein
MAFGDIGGPVTQLMMTCRTMPDGVVDIKQGDALILGGGNYVVTNTGSGAVMGQALADCDQNDAAIPVRLRGICRFTAVDRVVRGRVSLLLAEEPGKVVTFQDVMGSQLVLAERYNVVDVLL